MATAARCDRAAADAAFVLRRGAGRPRGAGARPHRGAVGLREAAAAGPQDSVLAARVWAARASAGRASGMVANRTSALSPHRAAHRGLPAPILAVFPV